MRNTAGGTPALPETPCPAIRMIRGHTRRVIVFADERLLIHHLLESLEVARVEADDAPANIDHDGYIQQSRDPFGDGFEAPHGCGAVAFADALEFAIEFAGL